MVIDTSAIVAILFGEPEADRFATAIDADPIRLMSSFSLLEAEIVVNRALGPAGERDLDLLLQKAVIEIVPLTAEHVELAREAYARFGKGAHPAGLNLGDCCSYALSRLSGQPLLFKGRDFARTDVAAANHQA